MFMFSEFDKISSFFLTFCLLTLFNNIFFYSLSSFEVFLYISLLLLYSIAFISYFLIRLSTSMYGILFFYIMFIKFV